MAGSGRGTALISPEYIPIAQWFDRGWLLGRQLEDVVAFLQRRAYILTGCGATARKRTPRVG